MSALDPDLLTERIHQLYRPSPRGHWQRRVQSLVGEWLGRPDARLCWSAAEEDDDGSAVRLPLPGRAAPPRWLGLAAALEPDAQAVALLLMPHLSTVATLMERQTEPLNRQLPDRWRQLLTPRQAQVAVLAAAGRKNDEIGELLSIAPRTVARLLQETYKRLDVHSRAELAAECALGRPPTPSGQ
jgi:DNA-binding CsgD family transcriptional regulator